MDKVFIEKLRVQCIIGVDDNERKRPQDILVSITLHADTRRAAKTDKIADCVDYETLSREIRALAERARRFTVEALAEDVARLCLGRPGVRKARVRVEKPGAVRAAETVGVEIERRK